MNKSINYNHIFRNKLLGSETGAGLLSVVAGTGIIVALVQGSIYYSAKTSNTFLSKEKHKTLAAQMAEAGIEENIADLGSGSLTVYEGMEGHTTYQSKALGSGAYTTTLTEAGVSALSDTVDIVSLGAYQSEFASISARLKVNKYIDTSLVPILTMAPETSTTITAYSEADTVTTTTQMTPGEMPALDAQPSYIAFLNASGVMAQICHLTSSDVNSRMVIGVSKNSVKHHVNHHGDYLTTDGTCDLYDPRTETSIAYVTKYDTTVTIDSVAIWDTVLTVSTKAKVQVLSWK